MFVTSTVESDKNLITDLTLTALQTYSHVTADYENAI